MEGIYKIKNKINDKVYIGESLDIRRRWREHICDLNNNEHINYKLQNDWNTYGEENFEFKIISVLDNGISAFINKYICLLYELKYIKQYDAVNKGYNIENTVVEIAMGNKSISDDNERDCIMLKKCIKKIKNEEIKEIGGIIYINTFSLNDVRMYIGIKKRIKFKNLLLNNDYIIKNKSSYILNTNIFKKENIIKNNKYSDIEFNEEIFTQLTTLLNEIIKSGKANFVVEKEKTFKTSKKPKKSTNTKKPKKSDILPEYPTIRNLLDCYVVNTTYNNVYRFLRKNNILERIERRNHPTKEFEDCFISNPYGNNNKHTLLLSEKGTTVIRDILLKNNIISQE